MNVGQRVRLASPYGELRRGVDGGALLTIPNGARGMIVGSAPSTGERSSVVVTFDDIGGTVGVSVAEHWLEMAP